MPAPRVKLCQVAAAQVHQAGTSWRALVIDSSANSGCCLIVNCRSFGSAVVSNFACSSRTPIRGPRRRRARSCTCCSAREKCQREGPLVEALGHDVEQWRMPRGAQPD